MGMARASFSAAGIDPGANRCRICGGDASRPRHRFTGLTVRSCGTCGFLQVDRRPTRQDLLGLYSGSYFADDKYQLDFAARREQRRRIKFMTACGVPRGARVLDVGCATGDFLLVASEQFEMSGLDISEEAVAIARQRNPALRDRIAVDQIENQNYADGAFDAIALWDVIEHLWQPVEVIRGLTRKLKPGGRLVLSTPDAGSPVSKLMGKRWAFMTPPEHLGFFDAASMKAMLKATCLLPNRRIRRGKWVSAGFLLYKLGRVFPFPPREFVEWVQHSRMAGLAIYVPTGDIMYVGARRPDQSPDERRPRVRE